jgi:hypothetical protein
MTSSLFSSPGARADIERCGSIAHNPDELNLAIAEFIGESGCTLIEIGKNFDIERNDSSPEPIVPIVIDPIGSPTAIAKSLTIDGNMHVLNGIGLPSGFVVYLAHNATPLTLTVRNLGMSGFGGSGAISVIGGVTIIEGGLFTDNQFLTSPPLPNFLDPTAGAVNALSSLTIKDSEFENNRGSNGGAIFNAPRPIELETTNGGPPPFIITGSTFATNDAHVGGAISAEQSLLMENSTLTGNTAVSAGGINVAGLVSIDFCTIVGNASSSNRAAVTAMNDITITNSIIHGNPFDPMGPSDMFADVASDGNVTIASSLVTSSDSITSTLSVTVLDTSNIVGEDPRLSLLGDFEGFTLPGGTRIHTRPPQMGSPVIDTIALIAVGNDDGPADQRGAGFPRFINGRADMGAVEYWPVVIPDPLANPTNPLSNIDDFRWSLNLERWNHLPDTK